MAADGVSIDPAELSRAFHQQLNEHGYPFHYAVIAEADNQHRLQRSRWALEAVEFPVEVRGRDTRVDIVLRHYWGTTTRSGCGSAATTR